MPRTSAQQILVYEFLTGGGWRSQGDPTPPASLMAEALAMVRAVTTDLAAVPDCQVRVLWDRQLHESPPAGATVCPVDGAAEERRMLQKEGLLADWSLVIAPETSGWLYDRCAWIREVGGRVLNPGPAAIRICASKHTSAEYLTTRGVPVPKGVLVSRGHELPRSFSWPAVAKPIDGCGSQDVRIVRAWEPDVQPFDCRLEEFCPGTPCSVAFLCGPRGNIPLMPCLQRLGGSSEFLYQGGRLPLATALAARAVRLAQRAIDFFEDLWGYAGVDLVLGQRSDGAKDAVIEVNPRLTTSYVGLRAAARSNLSTAMLAIAAGGSPPIDWRRGAWEFDAAGGVREIAHSC